MREVRESFLDFGISNDGVGAREEFDIGEDVLEICCDGLEFRLGAFDENE